MWSGGKLGDYLKELPIAINQRLQRNDLFRVIGAAVSVRTSCLRSGGRGVLRLPFLFGDGGSVLALYAGGGAVCGVRVRPLSGHDGGKADCRMDSLGGSDVTETSIPWRP